jgi:hypothetical protein
MKLLLATLPDKPDALAGWLERHLAGPALGELAAELTAVHGSRPAPADARGLLGEGLGDVLQHGLSALPAATLRTFLRHPALLFELQEIVLTEGGPYWDRLLTDAEVRRAAERTGRRLRVSLGLDAPPPPGKHVRLRFYRRPWLVGLATAAAVLAAVYFGRAYLEGLGRWGWERPGLAAKGETPSAYLTALADAAAEWRERPKDDRDSFTRTLREMRDGCTRLLAADHPALGAPDRDWLAGKCRDWGGKLDRHLTDLQTGKDWQAVRAEADETVEKLIKALRERGAQVQRQAAGIGTGNWPHSAVLK